MPNQRNGDSTPQRLTQHLAEAMTFDTEADARIVAAALQYFGVLQARAQPKHIKKPKGRGKVWVLTYLADEDGTLYIADAKA